MDYWTKLGIAVAALIVLAAVVLGLALLVLNFRTRPSASGGGKSAGSSERPRPWRRDAKAEGLAGPEAADTVPDGGVVLPPPPSGIRYFCVYCGVEVPLSVEVPALHEDYCPRSLAHHIDTAAALLQPDAPFLPMSELDAAVPSRPISTEEDQKWRGIVSGYRFTAAPAVPGGES